MSHVIGVFRLIGGENVYNITLQMSVQIHNMLFLGIAHSVTTRGRHLNVVTTRSSDPNRCILITMLHTNASTVHWDSRMDADGFNSRHVHWIRVAIPRAYKEQYATSR